MFDIPTAGRGLVLSKDLCFTSDASLFLQATSTCS